MQTDYQAIERATTVTAECLIATHPHLVPNDGNSLTTAAKNIRIELRRAFPSVKFTVKTSRFSGGNDINVSWVDGPTSSQVDGIIGRYQSGSFDGMTDCYNYDRDRGWVRAFGESKYVFANRSYSDRTIESVLRRFNAKWGTQVSVEDYRQGRALAVKTAHGDSIDASRMIGMALQKHTFCVGPKPDNATTIEV